MANPLDFFNEDDYNEAVHEEAMGYQGDARRCPRHPHIVTSSTDGLHDGLCGICEYETDFDSMPGLNRVVHPSEPVEPYGLAYTGGPFDDDIPF